jgi:hypothetical protein
MTDSPVRLRPELRLLLLERCELASTRGVGMRCRPTLPWILGNSVYRDYTPRSSEGLLPLFPSYVHLILILGTKSS